MKFESIEFKNVFAYGEEVQRIDYSSDGKLILLKGQSGAGKSAILSLPILVLYGKLTKVTKSAIANRVNKHGWVRGTIIKGQHKYVIEREFSPNSLKIWKDDEEVDLFGTSVGEDYIEKEIIEIPITTFTNMITISMKKFKSFLSLSPTERKGVVDEIFDVRIINMVFDQLKKDAKEIGASINGDNSTLFSLTSTLNNANNELLKIQQNNATPEAQALIEENKKKIEELNQQLLQYNDVAQKVSQKQQENNTEITNKSREVTENDMHIRTIREKINLYNQSKCPTCSSVFSGPEFDNLKKQLNDVYEQKVEKKKVLESELNELREKSQKIIEAGQKVQNGMYQIRLNINSLLNDNNLIEQKVKMSAEYQAVQNIINQTNEQMNGVKKSIEEKTSKLLYLQKLQAVYSIDGVTKMIINNYLPLLNDEIAENLLLLGFPYTLKFDNSFRPVLKDVNFEISVETLSDGEQTRIDLVVLLSLYKLLKRKYSSINLLTIDEVVSSLDVENSAKVMQFLKVFAEENNINVFIVSHTNLDLDEFDEVIEVEKTNGFSRICKGKLAR